MDLRKELELLQRYVARERQAREEAERLLEDKSLELYKVSEELRIINERLAQDVDLASTALKTQEQRLSEVFDAVQDIILTTSSDGTVTFVNPIIAALEAQ